MPLFKKATQTQWKQTRSHRVQYVPPTGCSDHIHGSICDWKEVAYYAQWNGVHRKRRKTNPWHHVILHSLATYLCFLIFKLCYGLMFKCRRMRRPLEGQVQFYKPIKHPEWMVACIHACTKKCSFQPWSGSDLSFYQKCSYNLIEVHISAEYWKRLNTIHRSKNAGSH